jgi:hypothetical protein
VDTQWNSDQVLLRFDEFDFTVKRMVNILWLRLIQLAA